AGLLLGNVEGDEKRVKSIFPLPNVREDGARHNRFLITAEDFFRGEQAAAHLGMDVIGVYHSHPDSPNRPSEYDRQWALPWFSYIITWVQKGQALSSRSWWLTEDRQRFIEEELVINAASVITKEKV
ncbi:MAG: M67 family metallopeptidase, partial [Anaerolineales bacterium]